LSVAGAVGFSRDRAAVAALAGLAAFIVLVVVQHPLRGGDLPPGEHFVSEYARGSTRAVQVVAFLCWAVSLALAVRLARGGVVTQGALAIAAVGAVLAACFATVTVAGELPDGATYTTAGRLHNLGSLLIFLGLLVAAPASVKRQRRRGYRLAVLGLAVALVAITPALVVLGIDSPGWGQRAFMAVGVAWQALFLAEVRRSHPTFA
jgi:uncharacterized protein DUF998